MTPAGRVVACCSGRVWAIGLFFCLLLLASSSGAAGPLRDRYDISVVTYGPGDHPFNCFGHNAIWVADKVGRRDFVYNFGTLDITSESLIQDFMQGKLRYWVSVSDLHQSLQSYEAENRSAEVQVLDLSPEQEEKLVKALRTNALPENRFYLYDYYQDNCSTRVRDLVDQAIEGSVKDVSKGPAGMTWREHTMRMSQTNSGASIGLDLALGPLVDEERSVWEEMFLPGVLQRTLRRVTIGEGESTRPLVKREYTLLEASRPPEPESSPNRVPLALLVGFVIGGPIWAAARWSRTRPQRMGRVVAGGVWALVGLVGALCGILGTILLFFWVATDHEIARRNLNILLFPPLGLLLLPCGALVPFWTRAKEALDWVLRLCVILAIFGSLIAVLPISIQKSMPFVALSLPVWGGLLLAVRELRRFHAEARMKLPRASQA